MTLSTLVSPIEPRRSCAWPDCRLYGCGACGARRCLVVAFHFAVGFRCHCLRARSACYLVVALASMTSLPALVPSPSTVKLSGRARIVALSRPTRPVPTKLQILNPARRATSPPPASASMPIVMSNDFTRVPLMNAMTTRSNFKRRSRKGPVLLLVAVAAAVTYVTLVD